MLCPFAEWRGTIPNRSTGVTRPARGLVLHVIVGSLASADAAFHNPKWQASAHFGVGNDGHLVQWVDTAEKAWAQAAGNPDWYSVETEGQPGDPLTPQQVETVAHLLAWLHTVDSFPLQVTDDVNGHGLISHRCGGKAWGGHPCPGDLRHAQRAAVVARAQQLANPQPAEVQPMYDPPLTDIVASRRDPVAGGSWLLKKDGAIFAIDGARYLGGANGKPYFAGRTAATFAEPNAQELAAGKQYVILSEQPGGRYAYPETP